LLSKAFWKKKIYAILSLDSHPGHIAAGFALGVFVGFTPFIGLHTPICIVLAFLFKLNKVACVTGSWINTPITVLPALGLSYQVGNFLRGESGVLNLQGGFSWHDLEKHAASLLLGSSLTGFIAAVISYFACYHMVVRFRAKDATQNALVKEMAVVGEELDLK